MQLTHGMETQATGSGGLLGSAMPTVGLQTSLPVNPPVDLSVPGEAVRMDFVVSRPVNQPDVRVTVPVVAQLTATTQLALSNAQQLTTTPYQYLLHGVEAFAHPVNLPLNEAVVRGTAGAVGSSLGGLLRTSVASGRR